MPPQECHLPLPLPVRRLRYIVVLLPRPHTQTKLVVGSGGEEWLWRELVVIEASPLDHHYCRVAQGLFNTPGVAQRPYGYAVVVVVMVVVALAIHPPVAHDYSHAKTAWNTH